MLANDYSGGMSLFVIVGAERDKFIIQDGKLKCKTKIRGFSGTGIFVCDNLSATMGFPMGKSAGNRTGLPPLVRSTKESA